MSRNTFYGHSYDHDAETGIEVFVHVKIVTPSEYNISSAVLDDIADDAVESVFVTAVPDLLDAGD